MNLPTLAVRRPITTAMILVSVLLVGAIAFFRLPLAFLPTLDAPFMFVQIPYPNSHPSQIEKEITKPVEEILSTLSGVKKLNSTTTADGARFFMEFNWGQEIDLIRLEASEKLDRVRSQLPADVPWRVTFRIPGHRDAVLRSLRVAGFAVDRLFAPLHRLAGQADWEFPRATMLAETLLNCDPGCLGDDPASAVQRLTAVAASVLDGPIRKEQHAGT